MLNNPLKYTDPTGELVYTYDDARMCYVDGFGNRVDYSNVYEAMFRGGYFRGRTSIYDFNTNYSYGYGYPRSVSLSKAGMSGGIIGYRWTHYWTTTSSNAGTISRTDANNYDISEQAVTSTKHWMATPIIDAEWLSRTNRNASALQSISSAPFTVIGTWKYNDKLGGGWRGVNGKYYKFANVQKNNHVFKNSANIAKNASSLTRGIGTGLGAASAVTSVASMAISLANGTHNTSTWVDLGIAATTAVLTLACGPVIVTGAVGVLWGAGQLVAGDAINGWIDDNFGYKY